MQESGGSFSSNKVASGASQDVYVVAQRNSEAIATVRPVMFGKPLLNNVLIFDQDLLKKCSDCWEFWVICQYLEFAKLWRCYS